jgi:ATP-dependent protease HslVU (ClpYQ) peptidase subunit
MTVVIGYTTPTESWMVFDSAAMTEDSSSIMPSITPKAIKHAGNGSIGTAGSWRVINVINGLKGRRCSTATIINALKEMKGEEDAVKSSEVICVWPNRPITVVHSDFAVIEYDQKFMAIGSGAPYALGYLESCRRIGEAELIKAVEIAAKYVPSVMGPVKSIHCVAK